MKLYTTPLIGMLCSALVIGNSYATGTFVASKSYVDNAIQDVTSTTATATNSNGTITIAQGDNEHVPTTKAVTDGLNAINTKLTSVASTANSAANQNLTNLSDTGKSNIAAQGKFNRNTQYADGTVGYAIQENRGDINALYENRLRQGSSTVAWNEADRQSQNQDERILAEQYADPVARNELIPSAAAVDVRIDSAVNNVIARQGTYKTGWDNNDDVVVQNDNDNDSNLGAAKENADAFVPTVAAVEARIDSAVDSVTNKIAKQGTFDGTWENRDSLAAQDPNKVAAIYGTNLGDTFNHEDEFVPTIAAVDARIDSAVDSVTNKIAKQGTFGETWINRAALANNPQLATQSGSNLGDTYNHEDEFVPTLAAVEARVQKTESVTNADIARINNGAVMQSGIDSTKVQQIATNTTNISNNTTAIATINGGATTEGSIAHAVKAEETRATNAEAGLNTAITAEVTRATNAETGLNTAIQTNATNIAKRTVTLDNTTGTATITDGPNTANVYTTTHIDNKLDGIYTKTQVDTELNKKVAKNANLPASASTKNSVVTYDAQGLVTGGFQLENGGIKSIENADSATLCSATNPCILTYLGGTGAAADYRWTPMDEGSETIPAKPAS